MKNNKDNRWKLLQWQRASMEVANSIGYRMIDERDVPNLALLDIATALESLAARVRREMEEDTDDG